VLLEILLCGVCGTDLEEFRHGPITIRVGVPHPLTGQASPVTLGHEILGRVIARGDSVTGLRIGDRVVPDGGLSCGDCPDCRAGHPTLCARLASIGLHRDGGLAERVIVPGSMCVPVPDDVPDRLAVLTEPLAVAIRAVRRAELAATDRVLVVGAGTIGQCVLQLVSALGAAPGVVDPDPIRLSISSAALPGLVVAEAAARHPWAGAADCVIDCAGSEGSLLDALAAVRPGGRVVLVGAAPAAPGFSPHDLLIREVTIVTSLSHDLDQDTRAAVRLLASRGVELGHVVASVLSMTEAIDRIFTAGATANPGGLKIVVDPSLAPGDES
jgi:(R,R)-butanediol dehydrogenase/meso-butanediol dehydrogenase/diacetyl reductase